MTGLQKVWATFSQRLKAITDERYDSPRNAIIATVSLLECVSGEILSVLTEDRYKARVTAQGMEPLLSKRILKTLKDHDVNIDVIAHDEYPSITKIINDWVNYDLSRPRSQLYSWHVFKNLAKKLALLLDQRSSIPPDLQMF